MWKLGMSSLLYQGQVKRDRQGGWGRLLRRRERAHKELLGDTILVVSKRARKVNLCNTLLCNHLLKGASGEQITGDEKSALSLQLCTMGTQWI